MTVDEESQVDKLRAYNERRVIKPLSKFYYEAATPEGGSALIEASFQHYSADKDGGLLVTFLKAKGNRVIESGHPIDDLAPIVKNSNGEPMAFGGLKIRHKSDGSIEDGYTYVKPAKDKGDNVRRLVVEKISQIPGKDELTKDTREVPVKDLVALNV